MLPTFRHLTAQKLACYICWHPPKNWHEIKASVKRFKQILTSKSPLIAFTSHRNAMLNGIPKGTKQDLSLSSSYIKLREAQNSMYWSYVKLMICKVQNYHQKIGLTMAAGRSCSLEDWITRGAKIAITANGNNHWATISFKSFVTYFLRVWWLVH